MPQFKWNNKLDSANDEAKQDDSNISTINPKIFSKYN